MRGVVVLCVWGLAACVDDNDYVPSDDTAVVDTDCAPPLPEVACGDLVTEVWPARGAADGFFRGPWVLRLAAPARDVTELFVAVDGGADIAGIWSWSDDGLTTWFQPAQPVAPGTAVRWAVGRGCCDTERARFTVSDVGRAVNGPVVDGSVFAVDPGAGVALAGSAVRDAIAADGRRWLLRLGDWDAERVTFSVDVAGAAVRGAAVVQDGCVPLARLADDAVFDATPWFVGGAARLATGRPGRALDWRGLTLGGGVAPRAAGVEGIEVQGFVTAASLAQVTGAAGPDAVCAPGGASACVPCPAEAGTACIGVHLVGITGEAWSGALEAISVATAEARLADDACLP
ncbi:MAG: hypothetical protein H6733_08900 [Alphaproteobacteria bacterium]|nr:hypothetical protein [Alphaproteobacteria bacterium]